MNTQKIIIEVLLIVGGVLLASCSQDHNRGSQNMDIPLESLPVVIEGTLAYDVEKGPVDSDGISEANFGELKTKDGILLIEVSGDVIKKSGVHRNDRIKATLTSATNYADSRKPIYTYRISNIAVIDHDKPQLPSKVFIPAPAFTQTLKITLQTTDLTQVPEGEWVQLDAERQTGPWIGIEADNLKKNQRWLISPPDKIEKHVADNVTWIVEPKGNHEFNVPKNASEASKRFVRFKSPGKYILKAVSSSCCAEPFGSNVISIEVTPRSK